MGLLLTVKAWLAQAALWIILALLLASGGLFLWARALKAERNTARAAVATVQAELAAATTSIQDQNRAIQNLKAQGEAQAHAVDTGKGRAAAIEQRAQADVSKALQTPAPAAPADSLNWLVDEAKAAATAARAQEASR